MSFCLSLSRLLEGSASPSIMTVASAGGTQLNSADQLRHPSAAKYGIPAYPFYTQNIGDDCEVEIQEKEPERSSLVNQTPAPEDTPTASQAAVTPNDAVAVSCSVCGKGFASDGQLAKHAARVHTNAQQQRGAASAASSKPAFKCCYCFKVLSHPSNLKRHIRTAHFEQSDRKLFTCDTCEKTFKAA